MSDLDKLVNFNTGDGIVRARVVRELEDTKVFLWAPERGTGYVKLEKGESDGGIPRRSPADYDDADPPGGGLTWHSLEEAEEEADG